MAAVRADFLVMQRRKAEAARVDLQEAVRKDWERGAYANWETRTDAMLKQKAVKQRYDSIRAQDKAILLDRRNRLAKLLLEEDAKFQAQIEALDEGPDQRRVRMENRARELRNKREAERKAYVDEQLERQWRLGCDALRNADSVNISKAVDAARGYQIEERLQLLQLERQEEAIFADMWLSDAERKATREIEEEKMRKQMDAEQTRILGSQVAEKQAVLDAEREERDREAAEMTAQWIAEKEAQERAEVERHRAQLASKLELDGFNEAKRSDRSRAYAKELAEDRERLAAILGKEAEDERIEREHHETLKRESLAYQKHLKMLMEKEAADEAELEKARNQDLGRAWDKRVAQWGREQAAREQLLQATLEGRQRQLEQKAREKAAASAHREAEKELLAMEVERINKVEQIKRDNELARQRENAAYLEQQMARRQFSRQLEVNSKVLERQAIDRAEQEYMDRVRREMAKTQSKLWG
eukprot:CAMPEP_0206063636 /NCGR_PEP_ID=MMETSP1466-20131121/58328_1 /ASSEMBLY_ACC=CAM_ASM_001126 /TAXON_ID=44452 /ORGANISM="Pavlova gyrans, Strain CCMP608" /LENGTH=473 /DNA_ID=CAMNT_0053439007 /DNA_START=13 /DNA_END=1434 /DNA_ORIENTATION=+